MILDMIKMYEVITGRQGFIIKYLQNDLPYSVLQSSDKNELFVSFSSDL